MPANSAQKGYQLTIRKRRADQISGFIWLLVGSFVIVQVYDLDYMDEFGPGPAFFPFWLGIVIILLGIGLLLNTTLISEEKDYITFSSAHAALQMILVMAGFFVFVYLIESAGFFLSSGLLFLFLLLAVERQGWKFAAAVAILSTLVIWGIFGVILKVQLPYGVLEVFRWSI